jgi:hypothetical protein
MRECRKLFAVSLPGNVTELLTALSAVMSAANVRWYLFGAQAVLIWGRPRLSADVDVTAFIPPAQTDSFLEAMTRAGFLLREVDATFVAETRVMPFIHSPSGLPLDLVLAGPGLEEDFAARAAVIDLEGSPVPLISPEDLIVAKVLAGRPKDIGDIRGILENRAATLDVQRIRSLLHLIEQALDRSDLAAVFEREWRDAAGESDGRPQE